MEKTKGTGIDQIPPNFQEAKKHQKSLQTGIPMQQQELQIGQKLEQCKCCGRIVQRKLFNIQCKVKDFSYLGAGYPLYFEYLKYCGFFILLLFISSGLYNLYTNIQYGNGCKEEEELLKMKDGEAKNMCHKNWITIASIGNKIHQTEYMEIQGYVNLISIFIVIMFLQYFRRNQRQLDNDCDTEDISAQDYTIIVKNIPTFYDAIKDDYDEDLKLFIEQNGIPGKQTNVVHVSLSFNLQKVSKIQEDIDKAIQQKQKEIKYFNENGEYSEDGIIDEINQGIYALIKKKNIMCQQLSKGQGKKFMKKHFTGVGFITFKTEQEKEDVITENQYLNFLQRKLLQFKQRKKDKQHQNQDRNIPKNKNNQLIYHGNPLIIQQAPSPADVYWKNHHFSNSNKLKRRILGMMIQLAMVGVSLSIILELNKIQRNSGAEEGADNDIVKIMAVTVSVFVTISNIIITLANRFITEQQKYSTKTQFSINYSKSTCITQFLNSAIVPFILQVIVYTTYYFGRITGSGGLLYNMFYIMLFNSFLPGILMLIDPERIIKKFLLKIQIKLGKKSVLTQHQLNELYEDPEFDISERYAAIINIVYMTTFYTGVLPLSSVIGMFAVVFQYWSDKFSFIKRRIVKSNLSAELSIEMTEQLEYVLPIFSGANIMFYIYMKQETPPISYIIGFLIGFFHCLLPMQYLNEIFFSVRPALPNQITYEEASDHFFIDYITENPVTYEEGKIINQKKLIKLQSQSGLDKLSKQEIDTFQSESDEYYDGSIQKIGSQKQINSKFKFQSQKNIKYQKEKEQKNKKKSINIFEQYIKKKNNSNNSEINDSESDEIDNNQFQNQNCDKQQNQNQNQIIQMQTIMQEEEEINFSPTIQQVGGGNEADNKEQVETQEPLLHESNNNLKISQQQNQFKKSNSIILNIQNNNKTDKLNLQENISSNLIKQEISSIDCSKISQDSKKSTSSIFTIFFSKIRKEKRIERKIRATSQQQNQQKGQIQQKTKNRQIFQFSTNSTIGQQNENNITKYQTSMDKNDCILTSQNNYQDNSTINGYSNSVSNMASVRQNLLKNNNQDINFDKIDWKKQENTSKIYKNTDTETDINIENLDSQRSILIEENMLQTEKQILNNQIQINNRLEQQYEKEKHQFQQQQKQYQQIQQHKQKQEIIKCNQEQSLKIQSQQYLNKLYNQIQNHKNYLKTLPNFQQVDYSVNEDDFDLLDSSDIYNQQTVVL